MSWLCKVAGHSFEARYDKGASELEGEVKATRTTLIGMAEAYRKFTYRCDVCTRCGMVVNRQEGK